MGSGKVFCILGGIITLLATFLFSFAYNIFGIGFLLNIPLLFQTGIPLIIIMTIVFIIFLFSGLFIILGVKSRVIAIIGSIFAIAVGAYFLLTFLGVLPLEIAQFAFLFSHLPLVPDIIPLLNSIMVYAGYVGLGTYFLLGGGVLGLIGGIMGPSDF